jgi:parvulin-like peptidyl-prolyl isomerase
MVVRPRLAPRVVAGVALALALAASAGCNDKALQTSVGSDAGKRLGGAITPEQAGKVLARVGEHTITLGEFVAAIEHMDQFDRLRYQSPERRRELLAEMINIQLLADEAEAKGYDKDPRVQQEIRATLREAMMAQLHEGAPTSADVSEADVRAYYDKNRAAFHDPERRRVSAIVLTDAAKATTVLDLAKKTTTSAEWGALVKQYSTDPSAKGNVPVDLTGDLGIVSATGETQGEPNTKVPPEVRTAIFQVAKIGDVYDKLVPTTGGKIYIVRLTQRTDAHERTFAEADRSIRVKLVQEKLREREDALVAQLKAEFPVQIDDAVLATVRVPNVGDGGATAPSPPSGDAGAPAPAHS